MNTTVLLALLGGGALLMIVIIFLVLFRQSRQIDLDSTPEGEQPEWIKSSIPPETREAARADGEGVTLFDHDPGEDLAAAFAEQIEDILRAEIKNIPELEFTDVDFGTAPDGGIEFHIQGETYTVIDEIPNPRLQQAIRDAIQKYNQQN